MLGEGGVELSGHATPVPVITLEAGWFPTTALRRNGAANETIRLINLKMINYRYVVVHLSVAVMWREWTKARLTRGSNAGKKKCVQPNRPRLHPISVCMLNNRNFSRWEKFCRNWWAFLGINQTEAWLWCTCARRRAHLLSMDVCRWQNQVLDAKPFHEMTWTPHFIPHVENFQVGRLPPKKKKSLSSLPTENYR